MTAFSEGVQEVPRYARGGLLNRYEPPASKGRWPCAAHRRPLDTIVLSGREFRLPVLMCGLGFDRSHSVQMLHAIRGLLTAVSLHFRALPVPTFSLVPSPL